MDELTSNSIECFREAEADELIVEKAVNEDTSLTKIIVAEDIEKLIILTTRAKSEQISFGIYADKIFPRLLFSEF